MSQQSSELESSVVTDGSLVRRLLSEGAIIAGAPVVVYLIVFKFEEGFAAFFGIPPQFISLGVTSIFVAAKSVSMILLLVVSFAGLVLIFIPVGENVLYARVLTVLPLLLLLVGYVAMYESHWREWVGSVFPLVFLILIQFGVPLIVHRDIPSLMDRLRAWAPPSAKHETIFDRIMEKGGRAIIRGLFYMWFVLSLSYNAGRAEAIWQRDFLVTSTSPEMVVLRVFGDYLIAAPLDRGNKKAQRSFVILKVAADPKLELRLEEIGPLSSEPVKDPKGL